MTKITLPNVPIHREDIREHMRMVAIRLNQILDGKINATGSMTLGASSATTTLTDLRIGPDSVILLVPTTANGATEYGKGIQIVPTKESATLTHSNNGETDRTFNYVVLG